jgi:tetratricopeptide (TPR) repeat protein
MNFRNFFTELKRRNVYKVAVAYVIVGWLLVQVATQVFPFFEIPNWTVGLVVLLIVIGFPIALVIAWAFELTPEGLKRTETADAEHPPGRSRKRAWIYVVITAAALSVEVFLLGRYTSSKSSEGAKLPAKSIAVLPFANLSRDPDNEYFAAGIQDEIITRLSKIAELKVRLGQILFLYDLDFAGSTREFERTIELNPNYATAHHWYGGGPSLALGEFDRAIAELNRAQKLDPLSLIINADLGNGLIAARRYDEAIAQLRKTIEMDPRFYYAHWNLGEALELKGELPEALAEYKKAAELEDNPIVLGLIAHAYAKLGERDQAVKLLAKLQQLAEHRYVPSGSFAAIYMALGEKDKAIDCFERSYRDRDGPEISGIKVDPMLDPLRGDPCFEALVVKIFSAQKSSTPSP